MYPTTMGTHNMRTYNAYKTENEPSINIPSYSPNFPEYIRPFKNAGEDRRPTLTWPRQIPIEGEPIEVVEEVGKNAEFHKNSDIPKLFINAEPGSILTGDQREFVRTWANTKEITVKGYHFIQEHSPNEIGEAIKDFLSSLS